MRRTFSGNKDVDRYIFFFLPDKDLFTVCGLNKYLFTNVCDDNFFHNKLLKTYPETLKYWHNNKTYKEFYLIISHYINKLKKQFNYSYVKGNPQTQYDLLNYNQNAQSLLYVSIEENDIELVKESIKRGAYINGYDSYALKISYQKKRFDIFNYLFEHETNSNRNEKF